MSPLFKKLNFSNQAEILVTANPPSFEPELDQLDSTKVIRKSEDVKQVSFAIFFVQTLADVAQVAQTLESAPGDPVIWLAYPKGTSKNYQCEFNRDTGWQALGEAGFEGVRQVAIDADWSALRFRRTEHIKTLRRNPSMALSKEGKRRTRGQN